MSKFLGTLAGGKPTYAFFALYATAVVALPAQTFTTLESLNGTNGEYPVAGLVQGADGNLYGTTEFGGEPSGLCYTGCGTVFKITPSGTLTTLWNFCAGNYSGTCPDGAFPRGGLVLAVNGHLYGTTANGGNVPSYPGCPNGEGCGTVFEINLSATPPLTTIYRFCTLVTGNLCTDGFGPLGTLVQATNGDFYGTTVYGGASGNGNVFKITPNGTLTTLYSFCAQSGCPDGSDPYGSLVQAANGDFYGTTSLGGANSGGTVFKITPGGLLTTLHSFCAQSGCTDGANPMAGLIQATNGYLYGTTYEAGANGGGTVFKITPSGTLTTLYNFCSQGLPSCADGAYPAAGLVQAATGALYGITGGGGANGNQKGTIFEMSPSGTFFKTLYSFCPLAGSCTDGEYPVASLVQDTNGKLYGTTENGGTGTCVTSTAPTCGTIFRLSLGLGPFITTVPTAGVAGETVTILGTNLTGATGVTFDGTAATITNNSSSAITTTVPAGASSGTVEVVTPNGTLSSNVTFRVLP
jgi:uncharacterized repeat protein (TIGR03803 family)